MSVITDSSKTGYFPTSWKDSVSSSAALPLTGNSVGDTRVAQDTGAIYAWTGAAWVTAGGLSSPVGISDGGTGQTTATAAFNALSPLTTKGDIIAHNGTGAVRHAVGTNGYILTSASGASTGLAWIQTLPIANGGTNSTTSLNNNRVMQSSSGSIVEAAAITASRALVSDTNGIPTHSTVTTTELAYVSGVTSAIQTQLNAKAPTSAPTFTTSVTFGNYRLDPKRYSAGNSSTAVSVDLTNGNIIAITLTASNPTVTLTNPQADSIYVFELTQDGTGSRTLPTFSPAFAYGTDGAPTLSTTASKVDYIHVYYTGSAYRVLGYKLGF